MIYMDYSATSYVKDEVLDEMMPYFKEKFGNASSVHGAGREARKAVDAAREKCASAIGAAQSAEIFFTSGGTESDNIAIRGVCAAYEKKGKHIITSTIEHHAVLHTFEEMEKKGFDVTYVPVKDNGVLDMEAFKNAVRPDTILVSVMFANNEIGTIQPIKEIGEICREKGIVFHTDAVQAMGNVPINVEEFNIDMMSISGHKIYSPKGIGILYVRKGIKFTPVMTGGSHERGKRPGTENVAGIVGLAKAMEIASNNVEEHSRRLTEMRDKLIDGIFENVPYVRLNGDREQRLCNNVNISFKYVEGESLLLNLDLKGICASSGSACTSGSLDPSHVLLGIGLDHETAHGSIRFSLGDGNTMEDIDYVIEVLPGILKTLRAMSPLYEEIEGGNK